jgi:hypothetical protein
MDPRHPLHTAADLAPDTEFERREQLLHSAAIFSEDDAGAKKHGANTVLKLRFVSLSFPLAADKSQEIRTRWRAFGESFVVRGTIEAHGRSTHKHASLGGFLLAAAHRLNDFASRVHSRIINLGFDERVPTFPKERLTGEVHNAIGVFNFRFPARLSHVDGFDLMAFFAEELGEACSDKARGSGDYNVHSGSKV